MFLDLVRIAERGTKTAFMLRIAEKQGNHFRITALRHALFPTDSFCVFVLFVANPTVILFRFKVRPFGGPL